MKASCYKDDCSALYQYMTRSGLILFHSGTNRLQTRNKVYIAF